MLSKKQTWVLCFFIGTTCFIAVLFPLLKILMPYYTRHWVYLQLANTAVIIASTLSSKLCKSAITTRTSFKISICFCFYLGFYLCMSTLFLQQKLCKCCKSACRYAAYFLHFNSFLFLQKSKLVVSIVLYYAKLRPIVVFESVSRPSE